MAVAWAVDGGASASASACFASFDTLVQTNEARLPFLPCADRCDSCAKLHDHHHAYSLLPCGYTGAPPKNRRFEVMNAYTGRESDDEFEERIKAWARSHLHKRKYRVHAEKREYRGVQDAFLIVVYPFSMKLETVLEHKDSF